MLRLASRGVEAHRSSTHPTLPSPPRHDIAVLRDVSQVFLPQGSVMNPIGFSHQRGVGFGKHALGSRVAGPAPGPVQRQPDEVLVGGLDFTPDDLPNSSNARPQRTARSASSSATSSAPNAARRLSPA